MPKTKLAPLPERLVKSNFQGFQTKVAEDPKQVATAKKQYAPYIVFCKDHPKGQGVSDFEAALNIYRATTGGQSRLYNNKGQLIYGRD